MSEVVQQKLIPKCTQKFRRIPMSNSLTNKLSNRDRNANCGVYLNKQSCNPQSLKIYLISMTTGKGRFI